jgi:hypothetical protein
VKRLLASLAGWALLACAAASPAGAQLGFEAADVTFTNADGTAATQAGSHPFEMTTTLDFETVVDPILGEVPAEDPKTLVATQIPGFVGSPEATPRCPNVDFLNSADCPNGTKIGIVEVEAQEPGEIHKAAVYNLVPPPGVAAKFGFAVLGVPVTIEASVNPDPPYNIIATLPNIAQVLTVYGSKFTLWGNPADPAHDAERGGPADIPDKPFLTLPRSCKGPLPTVFAIDSWQSPGAFAEATVLTHTTTVPPVPQGFTGCSKLPLSASSASISAQPTTQAAESPTGMDFSIDITDAGIVNPDGIAGPDLAMARVTFPEGMTANPSLAEGLEACSEADLAEEAARPQQGAGCPGASKVGSVTVHTPLLEEEFAGSLYIATPFENPAGSLIALYMVIRNTNLGIIVKQTLEVKPNPQTGQLETIAEDIPELPVSQVKVHLREGARSPLISPRSCGSHEVRAELFPSSGTAPLIGTSSFDLISGPAAGPCPPGGTPPFGPGLQAGTLNNTAGAYAPFYMRLTRRDGDQDITRFSATLAPGLSGKLAGIAKCADSSIAAAAAKTGRAEQASPSCPAASQIGQVTAGAGVGSQLIYVPGSVYLAGAYKGAPLSVVAIVPAVAGPFDVGVVVTRVGLDIDPKTAQVQVDGSKSDPIPHILAGIPLRVRDIRVHVDRPNFTLNPTFCGALGINAQLSGREGATASVSAPFRAADCASLSFRPRLKLSLKGGTKRGAHPALRAVYQARPGDANVRNLALTLPRSEFIENANIRTVCTRVQYAAESCPPGSIYGQVQAFTPLLDEALEGPVYLRSSDNLLPDQVFALHGIVDAEVAVRIDSVKGRLRATITDAPDVPVSRVVVQLRAGRKSLLVNSRDICKGKNRAKAELVAQSGKRITLKPRLRPTGCGKN